MKFLVAVLAGLFCFSSVASVEASSKYSNNYRKKKLKQPKERQVKPVKPATKMRHRLFEPTIGIFSIAVPMKPVLQDMYPR